MSSAWPWTVLFNVSSPVKRWNSWVISFQAPCLGEMSSLIWIHLTIFLRLIGRYLIKLALESTLSFLTMSGGWTRASSKTCTKMAKERLKGVERTSHWAIWENLADSPELLHVLLFVPYDSRPANAPTIMPRLRERTCSPFIQEIWHKTCWKSLSCEFTLMNSEQKRSMFSSEWDSAQHCRKASAAWCIIRSVMHALNASYILVAIWCFEGSTFIMFAKQPLVCLPAICCIPFHPAAVWGTGQKAMSGFDNDWIKETEEEKSVW